MRPPEFTGGNAAVCARGAVRRVEGFNEAAGIHRRKPAILAGEIAEVMRTGLCFNEAAGIHRRKRRGGDVQRDVHPHSRFNEAAGIHRRKLDLILREISGTWASMRPPEFTGGNLCLPSVRGSEADALQ